MDVTWNVAKCNTCKKKKKKYLSKNKITDLKKKFTTKYFITVMWVNVIHYFHPWKQNQS